MVSGVDPGPRHPSAQPLGVKGVTDIKADPGCSRAMDPDMDFGISLGKDNTQVLGGIAGQHGPSSSMSLRLQHGNPEPELPVAFGEYMGHRHQPRPSSSTDSDMIPGYSSGLDGTMALGGSAGLYGPVAA